jgi:hypothetical protein
MPGIGALSEAAAAQVLRKVKLCRHAPVLSAGIQPVAAPYQFRCGWLVRVAPGDRGDVAVGQSCVLVSTQPNA